MDGGSPDGRGRAGRALVAVVGATAAGVLAVRAAGALGVPDTWLTVPLLATLPWVAAAAALVTGGVLLRAGLRAERLRPVELVVVLAATGCLLVLVPRATPAVQPVADGEQLTLAVVNVKVGAASAAHVAALVRTHDVDVLVVLELTDAFDAALRAAGTADDLPRRLAAPGRTAAGGGVYAAVPMEPSRPPAVGGDTPDVLLDVGGTAVELVTTHPVPPVGPRRTAAWLAALARVGGPAPGRVSLVAGDLNATLDHRALRDVLARGWRDAAAEAGTGLQATFDGVAARSVGPPMTLDHVLVGPGIAVEQVAAHAVRGSDHRMLVARLRLPDG